MKICVHIYTNRMKDWEETALLRKIMQEVDKLPIHKFPIDKEEKNNEHEQQNL